jgi:hypothetical protein
MPVLQETIPDQTTEAYNIHARVLLKTSLFRA